MEARNKEALGLLWFYIIVGTIIGGWKFIGLVLLALIIFVWIAVRHEKSKEQ